MRNISERESNKQVDFVIFCIYHNQLYVFKEKSV